jgi:hypothetical protein
VTLEVTIEVVDQKKLHLVPLVPLEAVVTVQAAGLLPALGLTEETIKIKRSLQATFKTLKPFSRLYEKIIHAHIITNSKRLWGPTNSRY